jgi:hypothetical protein
MGCWGFGSDENDDAYDAVGFDIPARLCGGIALTEEGKLVTGIAAEHEPEELEEVGLCILLLKLGCVLLPEHIITVVTKLEAELQNHDDPGGYTDAEKRHAEINNELSMCKEALGNGGVTLGEPRGLKGIMYAMQERMGRQQQEQEHEHEKDINEEETDNSDQQLHKRQKLGS